MKLMIELGNKQYTINSDFSWSAAIELQFNQKQPNHFGARHATAAPMTAGNFIGDTRQAGSCNVSELTLNPHCNGTHTETIQHICDADAELSLSISEVLIPALMPCPLISVTPIPYSQCEDDYSPAFTHGDKVISKELLSQQLASYENEQLQALAIRTLPNSLEKCTAEYSEGNSPPFFTRDAILYLNQCGVSHLIVDLPSIDRLHDDGLLTCHHLFWQVIEGQHQPTTNSLINKTITEMAYFDEQMSDGFYLVNLQTPAFNIDAAPSRPMFYPAEFTPLTSPNT